MESSINERIKAVFELRGEKSVRAYALKRNLAPTTFGECLKGAEPRFSLLKAFLDGEPCISAEWLMRGVGEMFMQKKTEYADKLSDEKTGGYSSIRELQDRIVALEAENNVLREMVGLQKNKQREGKSA